MTRDEGRIAGCVAPPGLSSIEVVAAADSEADETAVAHLQSCPHCAARVRQMRQLQNRLRRQLYRLFCPTTDLLVDYCQGLLDPYQRAQVIHHLSICSYCAGEVALMESLEPVAERSAPRPGAFFAP